MDFPQDVTLEKALKLLSAHPRPAIKSETIALDDALGRIVTNDVTSAIDVPQTDAAAVDGYAIFHDDFEHGSLPVSPAIKAGHPFQGDVKRGLAYRIFTGAPMPKDADGNGPDSIAMQEHCTLDDNGQVILPPNLRRGANYRPQGENIAKGDVAIAQGTRLGPSGIGLLAAIGTRQIDVARRLTVTIFSMGDEIAEAGSEQGFDRGKIHDSNRPMLKQLLRLDGHEVIDGGIIPDDRDALTAAFGQAAKNSDVILSSGGSSEGDEDHARQAILDNSGGAVDFWRLALKPGRPMLAGRIDDVPVFAVPGNPVAAFVCYRLLVAPILAWRQGQPLTPALSIPAPAHFRQGHRKGRTEYLRARLTPKGIVLNGKPGAGVLTSLTGADGLVEIPSDHDNVIEGDLLNFYPLRESAL